MHHTEEADRGENTDQQELCVSDRTAHVSKYPFIEEFSDLIHSLSTQELEDLLTPNQIRLAKSFWEAENYGGSVDKAKKRLEDIYGPKWFKETCFKDHFSVIRDYYISFLLIDHKRQWDEKAKKEKLATLNQENSPSWVQFQKKTG